MAKVSDSVIINRIGEFNDSDALAYAQAAEINPGGVEDFIKGLLYVDLSPEQEGLAIQLAEEHLVNLVEDIGAAA